MSALHGRLEAVKILLTRGHYEPDTTDCCGTTPLMDALRSGHVDIADLLIQRHRVFICKVVSTCIMMVSHYKHLSHGTDEFISSDKILQIGLYVVDCMYV